MLWAAFAGRIQDKVRQWLSLDGTTNGHEGTRMGFKKSAASHGGIFASFVSIRVHSWFKMSHYPKLE